MVIEYRFLEGLSSSDKNSIDAYGIAFVGYFDDPMNPNPNARFMNKRMERDYTLQNKLEDLSDKDIPDYLKPYNLSWSDMNAIYIDTSAEENECWDPGELLIDRWHELERLRQTT